MHNQKSTSVRIFTEMPSKMTKVFFDHLKAKIFYRHNWNECRVDKFIQKIAIYIGTVQIKSTRRRSIGKINLFHSYYFSRADNPPNYLLKELYPFSQLSCCVTKHSYLLQTHNKGTQCIYHWGHLDGFYYQFLPHYLGNHATTLLL